MARKRPRDVISVLSDDEVHFTTTSGAIDLTSDDDGDAAARPAAAIDRLAELLERQNDTQRERDLRREREHRLQCVQIRGRPMPRWRLQTPRMRRCHVWRHVRPTNAALVTALVAGLEWLLAALLTAAALLVALLVAAVACATATAATSTISATIAAPPWWCGGR